jgi:hypothetical protein
MSSLLPIASWALCVFVCLGGCGADQEVIGVEAQPCREVRDLPIGSLCNFDRTCVFVADPPPYASPCCVSYVSCDEGWLSFVEDCAEQCRSCSDDSQCLAIQEICSNGLCVPCADRSSTPACSTTTRNGCQFADCS